MYYFGHQAVVNVKCLAISCLLALSLTQLSSAQSQMLIVDFDADRVVRFDATSGLFVDWFAVSINNDLDGPNEGVFAPNGELLVASGISNTVRRFDGETGQPLGTLISSGQAGLSNPADVQIGLDGKVYVTSYNTDTVIVYDPGSSGVSTFISVGNNLDGPYGIDQDAQGNWYVASDNSDRVIKYSSTGVYVGDVLTSSDGIDQPRDVIIDSANRLLVASRGNDRVVAIDLSTSAVTTLIDENASGALALSGLTIEPATGHLLVVGFGGNGHFRRYDSSSGSYLGEFLVPQTGVLSGDPAKVLFKPDASTGCYADCDLSGTLDFFDFLCFENAFAAGCP